MVLRDDIRPQSAPVVEELRGEKLRTVVLTGDRKAAAEHLRAELKLDDVRAELKPDQKVAVIRELSAQGAKVAMIGDGVNDAPSLAAAHIGVAMGARGADAALEQADVVLMHDRLENFLAAFRLSQRARRIIRWNLVISLGTVVVLVTFALLGKIRIARGCGRPRRQHGGGGAEQFAIAVWRAKQSPCRGHPDWLIIWSAATCRRFLRRDMSRRIKAQTCLRSPSWDAACLLAMLRMHP